MSQTPNDDNAIMIQARAKDSMTTTTTSAVGSSASSAQQQPREPGVGLVRKKSQDSASSVDSSNNGRRRSPGLRGGRRRNDNNNNNNNNNNNHAAAAAAALPPMRRPTSIPTSTARNKGARRHAPATTPGALAAEHLSAAQPEPDGMVVAPSSATTAAPLPCWPSNHHKRARGPGAVAATNHVVRAKRTNHGSKTTNRWTSLSAAPTGITPLRSKSQEPDTVVSRARSSLEQDPQLIMAHNKTSLAKDQKRASKHAQDHPLSSSASVEGTNVEDMEPNETDDHNNNDGEAPPDDEPVAAAADGFLVHAQLVDPDDTKDAMLSESQRHQFEQETRERLLQDLMVVHAEEAVIIQDPKRRTGRRRVCIGLVLLLIMGLVVVGIIVGATPRATVVYSTPAPTVSLVPSTPPSLSPSASRAPSLRPSALPTTPPSPRPTASVGPSHLPSALPTVSPSQVPSSSPSVVPSHGPSQSAAPTTRPSGVPTQVPSASPTTTPNNMYCDEAVPLVLGDDDMPIIIENLYSIEPDAVLAANPNNIFDNSRRGLQGASRRGQQHLLDHPQARAENKTATTTTTTTTTTTRRAKLDDTTNNIDQRHLQGGGLYGGIYWQSVMDCTSSGTTKLLYGEAGRWYSVTGTGAPATLSMCPWKSTGPERFYVYTNVDQCDGDGEYYGTCLPYLEYTDCSVTWPTLQNQKFLVLVTAEDGYSSSLIGYEDDYVYQGEFTLPINFTLSTNNVCPNAAPIDLSGQSRMSGSSKTVNSSFWYLLEARGTSLVASTCGESTMDTIVTIYSGFNCEALNLVESVDDGCGVQSLADWASSPGEIYYVHVRGKTAGSFVLQINGGQTATTSSATPANNVCENAEVVENHDGGPITISNIPLKGSTIDNVDTGNPIDVCSNVLDGKPGRGVWYEYVATSMRQDFSITGAKALIFQNCDELFCVETSLIDYWLGMVGETYLIYVYTQDLTDENIPDNVELTVG